MRAKALSLISGVKTGIRYYPLTQENFGANNISEYTEVNEKMVQGLSEILTPVLKATRLFPNELKNKRTPLRVAVPSLK